MYGKSNRFKLLVALFLLIVTLTVPVFLSCSEDEEDTSSQVTPATTETDPPHRSDQDRRWLRFRYSRR